MSIYTNCATLHITEEAKQNASERTQMLLRTSPGSRRLIINYLLSEYNLLFTIIPQSITKKINSFLNHDLISSPGKAGYKESIWSNMITKSLYRILTIVTSVLLVYSHSNG